MLRTSLCVIAMASCSVTAKGQCHTIEPTQEISPSTGAAALNFGALIAMDHGTLAITAPNETVSGQTDAGAVYIFEKIAGAWMEVQRIVAPDPAAADYFGKHLDIHGDRMAVVASGVDVAGNTDAGAVYVLERVGGTWAFLPNSKLTSQISSVPSMDLSQNVSIDGNLVVVSGTGSLTGALTFERVAGIWTALPPLSLPVAGFPNHFDHELINGELYAMSDMFAISRFIRSSSMWVNAGTVTSGNSPWLDYDDKYLVIATTSPKVGFFDPANQQLVQSIDLGFNGYGDMPSVSGDLGIHYKVVSKKIGGNWEARAQTNPPLYARSVASGDQVLGVNSGKLYVFDTDYIEFKDRGTGCPGSGGYVPTLTLPDCPIAGSSFNMGLHNGLGGSFAIILVGSDIAEPAIPLGALCSVNLSPIVSANFALPLPGVGPGNGSIWTNTSIPASIPSGTEITVQAIVADPGANAIGATSTKAELIQVK